MRGYLVVFLLAVIFVSGVAIITHFDKDGDDV